MVPVCRRDAPAPTMELIPVRPGTARGHGGGPRGADGHGRSWRGAGQSDGDDLQFTSAAQPVGGAVTPRAPQHGRNTDGEPRRAQPAVGDGGHLLDDQLGRRQRGALASHLEGEQKGVSHHTGQLAHPYGDSGHRPALVRTGHFIGLLDESGGDRQLVHQRATVCGTDQAATRHPSPPVEPQRYP